MIPQEVLDQLRDIETPPPAGFWPPAPGWWLLAALVLAVTAVLLFAGWRRYQRNAPKRQALARLDRYPVPATAEPDWYAGLNQLLKETAMSRYPTQNPAGLSGAQWSDFLAQTSGEPAQPWQELASASYRPGAELAPAEAARMAEQWIRRQTW